MYLVTNSQMKAVEQKAITAGVPSLLLMENAALSLTKAITDDKRKSVLVFCGKGNNGGDGLACARQLYAHGIETTIIFAGSPSKATEDCKVNLKAANALDIPIIYLDRDIDDINELVKYIDRCDAIADALVGTGLESALREPLLSLVRLINASGKPVYSADCPTGISTDSGDDFGCAVYAYKTVTFHMPKLGLMLYPACEHTGEIITGNISLPQNGIKSKLRTLSEDEEKALMPRRIPNSNKGTYGKVFAFVGSRGMTGAAVLSLKSAYRAGAGLVYAFAEKHCASVIQNSLYEAVVNTVPDTDGYIDSDAALTDTSRASSVLIGCGLGCNGITHDFLSNILKSISSPLVLDADALNIIASDNTIALPPGSVITPHIGEMSRLTGISIDEIKKHPVETAADFARQHNVITVLKDFRTVVASPDGDITINTAGTPAMSKGGSGDCLAGIIASLLAQGMDNYNAASLGCYINGKAGEIAEKRLSAYGVLASDIADSIPYVFGI